MFVTMPYIDTYGTTLMKLIKNDYDEESLST